MPSGFIQEPLALITDLDAFECITRRVAEILEYQLDQQYQQAVADSLPNKEDWNIDVFEERLNFFERYQNGHAPPLINVSYSDSTTDEQSSSFDSQIMESIINIDCYAAEPDEETDEGHNPSDYGAAITAQRVARLARNVIMAEIYTTLQLPEIVHEVRLDERRMYQPSVGEDVIMGVMTARLALRVRHEEENIPYVPYLLDGIDATIERLPDGLLYYQYQKDYGSP